MPDTEEDSLIRWLLSIARAELC